MAQKVTTTLVDDLTGGEADETVVFGVDGVMHEIDLSSMNAEQLRNVLEPFRVKARRVSGHKVARKVVSQAPQVKQTQKQAREERTAYNAGLRVWAASQGVFVGEVGRIPAALVAQYAEHLEAEERKAQQPVKAAGRAKKSPAEKPAAPATFKAPKTIT